MFENKGVQAVIESIMSLTNQQKIARFANILKKVHYYEGTSEQRIEYLKPYLKIKRTDELPYSFTNITKRIVDRVSCVYKNSPTRTFEGKEYEDYPVYAEKKNQSMKIAERMTNLLGNIAVRVMWNQDRGRFEYIVVRYFEPFFEGDSLKPTGLMYPLNNGDNKPEYWMVWNKEENYVIDTNGNKIKEQEEFHATGINPYGDKIPWAFLCNSPQIDSFWVAGKDDVVEANNKIDFALTNLNYAIRYSTFKQAYGKGIGLDASKVEVGYNKFMAVEGNPADVDLGVLDLTTNLNQTVEAIKFQIQMIERNNNLSINWGMDGGVSSGFSLVVQNIDLLSAWEDDIDIVRNWESDIYEAEKLVAQVDAGKALPDKMNVDFSEVQFPIDPAEERAKWEWEWANGLSSKLDYLKEKSPDTPEEELKQRLIDNAKETGEIKKAGKPVMTLEERLGQVNA